MKKLFFVLAAVLMTVSAVAQEKMKFVIEGSEDTYNQIWVVNKTSVDHFRCRVLILDENDQIRSEYGVYEFTSRRDSDSNTDRIRRGTKIGIQLPEDFTHEVSFSVEYRDFPLFDAVVIYLRDKDNGNFSSEF